MEQKNCKNKHMDVIYIVLAEYLQQKQNICLYLETVQRKKSI